MLGLGLRFLKIDFFTSKIKHKKKFSGVISTTQSNSKKCFPLRKIFSSENILLLENILHIAKHFNKTHHLTTQKRKKKKEKKNKFDGKSMVDKKKFFFFLKKKNGYQIFVCCP